jgi:phage-related holin
MHQDLAHWLKATLIVAVAFFAPVHKIMVLTGLLVAIDLFTGIAAAVKRKKKLTSNRLGGSIVKVAVYLVVICTAHIAEPLVPNGIPLTQMVTSLIGLRECLSVFENLNIVAGNNLLDMLISKLRSDNDKSK